MTDEGERELNRIASTMNIFPPLVGGNKREGE